MGAGSEGGWERGMEEARGVYHIVVLISVNSLRGNLFINGFLLTKSPSTAGKTEIILFHKPGQTRPELKIKMNGHLIIPSSFIKYFDETLSGNHHCDLLVKKLKNQWNAF